MNYELKTPIASGASEQLFKPPTFGQNDAVL